MNFAPAPLQYVRDVWQGILNEIKRVDGQENAKRDRANTFRGDQTVKGNLTATNLSGSNSGDLTLAGETYLTLSGQQITAAKITEAQQNTSDVTTANVSSAKHGYAPKSPADTTQFLNGAATPAYAQVKDSDLSTSDIATNNVSTTKHGFAPKGDNNAAHYLDGTGAYSTPAGGTGANPTATASDVAVNGSASTFMRSDGAPAVQKCSSSVFGLAKADGTTISAASGVISTASPVTAQSTPANPAATTNVTGVMMGLAGSITPTATGKILIIISGDLTIPALEGALVQIRTGTGTAPANGAALTGTARGAKPELNSLDTTAGAQAPFSVNAVVTGLTLNTAVWIDISLASANGASVSAKDISISAFEIK